MIRLRLYARPGDNTAAVDRLAELFEILVAGETTITIVGNLTDDPEVRFTTSPVGS